MQRLLEEYGLTKSKIMDRYDAVFHLVTAAKGAEEFYTLSNNQARTETIEQARILAQESLDRVCTIADKFRSEHPDVANEQVDKLLDDVQKEIMMIAIKKEINIKEGV